ncbi:hypothetical protein HKD30_09120 [Gluconobacter sphaericus]|uniref:hypothetical protein n=1 Tax=Gluconobacter sphaericus TaxID=574987 RepID=UPI001885669C|nr:hypothetical protein [Gluconobacter sphaericus]MBF0885943.1 hypothetical protein [Gluconobacter sphaericus]
MFEKSLLPFPRLFPPQRTFTRYVIIHLLQPFPPDRPEHQPSDGFQRSLPAAHHHATLEPDSPNRLVPRPIPVTRPSPRQGFHIPLRLFSFSLHRHTGEGFRRDLSNHPGRKNRPLTGNGPAPNIQARKTCIHQFMPFQNNICPMNRLAFINERTSDK